jgi:threonine/homoserine/homoserine lactone efflux protein
MCSNPELILFCVAFLTLFVNPARGRCWARLLILGVTLVAVDLLLDGLIGLAAGRLGRMMQRQRIAKALNIDCGMLSAGLAYAS